MYDLQKFNLRDMSECGLALRHLGDKAKSMEEASNEIIQYLYQNIINYKSSEKSCVLIRFFKTQSYQELTPELQEFVHTQLNNYLPENHLKCLILLATAGELPEWNFRHKSCRYQAVPLADEKAIAKIKMMHQLIQQLGINLNHVVQPDPNLLTDLEQKMYNVFYIPDALNNPYIPAQTSFVIPFNIKSVIGFGGILPSGNIFVVLMFLKVFVPRSHVDLLRPLALNVKLAILRFENERIFNTPVPHIQQHRKLTIATKDEIQNLKSQIATLNQLLDVSERSTISQSDRLEQTNINLQETLDELQKYQIQLINTEKMSSLGKLVAGIAHEINNPINFIYANLIYTQKYTNFLIELLQKYQINYPSPSKDIQEFIQKNDLDFLIEDLDNIINSMTVGTERITQIVQSLKTFSHLQEAEFKSVDIHKGLDTTLTILAYYLEARDNNPEIKIIKEYSELPLIECYPAQLNQVFMNILTNAIDAIRDSKAKFHDSSPMIRICTQKIDHKWIAISIIDNGCGIDETAHSKLFDPFFTTKCVGKGIGMGLSISYQIIVEKHGGQIYYTSVPKQGAEFVIKIPISCK